MTTNMNNASTRRGFLSGSALGFDHWFGYRDLFGQAVGDDAATILNLAATAETLACTHYYNVLTDSSIPLDSAEKDYLRSAMDAEIQHLEFLNANGAKTLATEFYFPKNVYTDRAQFSEITEQAETVFVAAYLAAVRRFTELGNPLLAATAAQVAVTEQVHLALIRQIGGRIPNHVSLGQALLFNTSDAGPVLMPFLQAGTDRIGPKKFPMADAIKQVIGDVGVVSIKPFTDGTLFAQGVGTPFVETGACTVTPARNVNVNIRKGAGLSFEVIGLLNRGTKQTVTAQSTDNNGFIWYRVESGGFVRSDVVKTDGTCKALPAAK